MLTKRPPSVEQLRSIQRDLNDMAKPYVQMKCGILATSLPTVIYYPETKKFETIYDAQTQAHLAQVDQFWTAERNTYLEKVGSNFLIHTHENL